MNKGQTYTFYFEIFGAKKKWSTVAGSRAQAETLFHAFLLDNANIVRVESAAGDSFIDRTMEYMESLLEIFSKRVTKKA